MKMDDKNLWHWATVKDMADFFNMLVAQGKGDYDVAVNTQDGASYGLSVSHVKEGVDKYYNVAKVYDDIKTIGVGD